MAFSKGHWTEPEKAHGWKNDKLEQWRELSKIGNQTTDRHILPESATIDKVSLELCSFTQEKLY